MAEDETEHGDGVDRRDFLRGAGKRSIGPAFSGGMLGWAIERARESREAVDDESGAADRRE